MFEAPSKIEDSEDAQEGPEVSAQPNKSFKYKDSHPKDLTIRHKDDPLRTRSTFRDHNCII